MNFTFNYRILILNYLFISWNLFILPTMTNMFSHTAIFKNKLELFIGQLCLILVYICIFYPVYDSICMLKTLCSPAISYVLYLCKQILGIYWNHPARPPVLLSVRPSICLSVSLSVCLTVCLFVYWHSFFPYMNLKTTVWNNLKICSYVENHHVDKTRLMILWESSLFIVYILYTYVEKDEGSLQILWN